MAELRTALTTAPIGEMVGSGQFVANVRALLNLPPAPSRPDLRPDRTGDRDLGLPLIASLAVPGQDAAAPPAASAGTDAGTLSSLSSLAVIGHEPHDATGTPGNRIISLQVGMDPNRDENPAFISSEGTEQIGVRSGYAGGWLENHVLFYAPLQKGMPGFEFNNASQSEIEQWASLNGPSDGRIDTLALSGDFSSGFNFSELPASITHLVLREGGDYVLELDDSFLAPGRTLTIHGEGVGSGHVIFDGSAETDAAFAFFGSDNDDVFFGGAANDTVRGGRGSDTLVGGGGSDTFFHGSAGESAGAAFDILADFDPAADRVDLPVTVSGFDASVTAGALSLASAGADLAAALGALGAGRAVLFTPDAGDLAGSLFLVVDGNGVAGYQEGEDYVFALPGTPLVDLSAHPAFFI